MKRALGVVSMLLMLHLSLVAADNMCATHGASKAAPVASQGGHHHHGQPEPSHGSQKENCDTPVSPDCCSALTSCAPTLVLQSAEADELAVVRVSYSTERVESAESRVTAPEPPPPRS